MELGDCTPSLVAHVAVAQCDNYLDGALLREFFWQRLPSSVHMVLAASEKKAVAELANHLVAITPPPLVAVVQEQQS